MNRTILGFLRKEFAQALRDPRMRVMLFVAPIVQVSIFGFALHNDIKNVKLAFHGKTWTEDPLLDQVYRRCLASGLFYSDQESSPRKDPFTAIQSGEADVVMVAPARGLTKSIERGEGGVQLLINASNAFRAQGIEQAFQSIYLQVLTERFPDRIPARPLDIKVRVLYNPTLETPFYMVPGVMAQLACLITIVLTSMSLSREKEMGTLETILATPVRSWEIIAGKMLPYILMGALNIPLVLFASYFLFGIPIRGPLWMLLVSSIAFVTTTVAIGIFISIMAKGQQQAMMGGFLFLFPSILLSGLIFPIENMPVAIRVFAYANPLTYFIRLLRNLLLKGGDLHLFAVNTSVLVFMSVVILAVCMRRFKSTIG